MAVLLTLMHTGLLGALLAFGSVSFYGEGRSVEDQQLAGLIMWVPGGLIYLIGGGWIAWRWLTACGAGRTREPPRPISDTQRRRASALREGAVSRVSCESSTDRYRPRPAVRPDHGRGTRRT